MDSPKGWENLTELMNFGPFLNSLLTARCGAWGFHICLKASTGAEVMCAFASATTAALRDFALPFIIFWPDFILAPQQSDIVLMYSSQSIFALWCQWLPECGKKLIQWSSEAQQVLKSGLYMLMTRDYRTNVWQSDYKLTCSLCVSKLWGKTWNTAFQRNW